MTPYITFLFFLISTFLDFNRQKCHQFVLLWLFINLKNNDPTFQFSNQNNMLQTAGITIDEMSCMQTVNAPCTPTLCGRWVLIAIEILIIIIIVI